MECYWYTEILVQLNDSDWAEGILSLVTHLARNQNSVLVLLSVDDPVANQTSVGYWNEQPDELEAVSTRLTTIDLKPEVRVAVGTFRPWIIEAAEAEGCNLIPTGTDGRSGSGRGVLESPANDLYGRHYWPLKKGLPTLYIGSESTRVGGADNTLG